ncbi:unnamed protein product [Arctogadus glacialis]
MLSSAVAGQHAAPLLCVLQPLPFFSTIRECVPLPSPEELCGVVYVGGCDMGVMVGLWTRVSLLWCAGLSVGRPSVVHNGSGCQRLGPPCGPILDVWFFVAVRWPVKRNQDLRTDAELWRRPDGLITPSVRC